MTEVKLIKLSLADRLKKAATNLYAFLENPESVRHPDAFLLATAHLMDTTSVELDSEITQLKRQLGGQNSRLNFLNGRVKKLEEENAVLRATLDKARNDQSPVKGMVAGYDGH